MRRVFLILGFLSLLCITGHCLPNHILQASYPSRSGQIALGFPTDEGFSLSTTSSSSSSSLYMNHPFTTTFPSSLQDTQVIDYLASAMGLAPLHQSVDRSEYPSTSIFKKPAASLLFILDDASEELLIGQHRYSQVPVASSYATASSLSLIETLFSGATPSSHGIVADAWFSSAADKVVDAFSSGDSFADAPSFLDLVASTEPRSLVFSLATANQRLAAAIGQESNLQTLTARPLDIAYLQSKIAACNAASMVAQQSEIRITINDQVAAFSLKDQNDLDLLVEVQTLFNFLDEMTCLESSLHRYTKDAFPDFFVIAISSIAPLEDSLKRQIGQQIVNHLVEQITSQLNAIYNHALLSSIFVARPALPDALQNACASLSQHEWVSDVITMPLTKSCPMIFTSPSLSSEQIAQVSKQLNEDAALFGVATYVLPQISARSHSIKATNSSSNQYTYEEVAVFQINLWMSILLFLILVAVVAAVYTLTWDGQGSPVFIETNTIQRNLIEGYKE